MVSSVSSLHGTSLYNSSTASSTGGSSGTAFAATMAELSAKEEASRTAAAKASGSGGTGGTGAATQTNWLLPANAATPSPDKPSLADFIRATGTDFDTASSLLYGTMGSNSDRRDWKAIMASGDPVAAARAGTGQMYGRPVDAPPLTEVGHTDQKVLASAGNYVVLDKNEGGSQTKEGELALVDQNGDLLRKLSWNAPVILSASRDFGFDTTALNELADQLDAQSIKYKPHELYEGSDAGVDLRDLAAGGLGSAYDWRYDENAVSKGESAVRYVASNLLMAQELGITGGVINSGYGGGGGGTATAKSAPAASGGSAAADGPSADEASKTAASAGPESGSTAELTRAIQSYAARFGSNALNTALNEAWSSLTH